MPPFSFRPFSLAVVAVANTIAAPLSPFPPTSIFFLPRSRFSGGQESHDIDGRNAPALFFCVPRGDLSNACPFSFFFPTSVGMKREK